MAKVASLQSLPSTSLQIGGGALNAAKMVKRKTPSELRGEQLKRMSALERIEESSDPVLGSKNDEDDGLKKQDLSRKRYTDTRIDEVYPVKKSRLWVLSVKETAKENVQSEQPNLKNFSVFPSLAAKRQQLSNANSSDGVQASQTTDKCSQSLFRSITDISLGVERSSSLADVDMNKALKGLAACELPAGLGLAADTFDKHDSLIPTISEFSVPGQKAPLDFTLKTKVRVTLSQSVNWIHRSMLSTSYSGALEPSFQSGCMDIISPILSSKALHSWVHPQSVLPPSVISVLCSSAVDDEFLRKRQLAWEDSFRCLYFMVRRNACSLFYVCTSHFIATFTSVGGSGKHLCNAYISQSTSGLRSLLREHDVSFSLPLCNSKVEQLNTEDLIELSEIEKQSLGQTRRPNSFTDMDNTPQSLLAFCGNKNVHGLYEFLLNYRSLLTNLSGVDVPILYSPIPFQNAAISAPEIRCVEVKKTDNINSPKETKIRDSGNNASTSFSSTIEIKDSYIPPWIVCRICEIGSSEGMPFEARFTTEGSSTGLNYALRKIQEKTQSQNATGEDLQERSCGHIVPESTVCQRLSSGYLNRLKYEDNSYTASMSPA